MFAARHWREIPRRYRLEAGKCTKCGKVFFPARLVCDECKSRDFEMVNLPEEGEIMTYTVIRTPPSGFDDEAPYAICRTGEPGSRSRTLAGVIMDLTCDRLYLAAGCTRDSPWARRPGVG